MRTPHRILPFLLLHLTLAIGCGSSLRIERPIQETPHDWLMAGGSPERTNMRSEGMSSPLELVWVYKTGGGFGSNAMSITGDILFIGTLNGEVHAAHLPTGEREGSRHVGGPVSGSPSVYRNLLIIPVSSDDISLIAHNIKTGQIIWEKRLGRIESSPLLYEGVLYIAAISGTVYALNPETGDIIWERELEGRIFSSPAGAAQKIFIGSTNRSLYALDGKNGSIRWRAELGGPIMTQPAIGGNNIYVTTFDSTLYSIQTGTGEIVWQQSLGARVYTGPSVSEAFVFAGASNGRLYAYSVSTGELAWKYDTAGVIGSEILISGNKLIFTLLDSSVNILDAGTGTKLWTYSLDARLKTTPVVWKDFLIICSEDRNVYAFRSISHVGENH
jgi:eukaryotic-like serine/threonine-protein kinase